MNPFEDEAPVVNGTSFNENSFAAQLIQRGSNADAPDSATGALFFFPFVEIDCNSLLFRCVLIPACVSFVLRRTLSDAESSSGRQRGCCSFPGHPRSKGQPRQQMGTFERVPITNGFIIKAGVCLLGNFMLFPLKRRETRSFIGETLTGTSAI